MLRPDSKLVPNFALEQEHERLIVDGDELDVAAEEAPTAHRS